jgi:methylenetetrahydrofolate dehydrogenase (NADP+)/methenyltetrahydrofolate cyclohydrolase/formyltetrahydrofolate synthetase
MYLLSAQRYYIDTGFLRGFRCFSTRVMDSRILSGKELGQALKSSSYIPRIQALEHSRIVPGLAIVQVGAKEDSNVYIRMKLRLAKELGIRYEHIQLEEDGCSESNLIQVIQGLNSRSDIHGILIQLPLPSTMAHIDTIMESVDPKKDVDGFHSFNTGQLSKRHGSPFFIPCTAKGILFLIQQAISKDLSFDSLHKLDLSGKTAVVIGRSDIVGAPVSQLLLKHNATVIHCHSKTSNLERMIGLAEILVVAIGKPKFVSGNWIRPGTIVIDVGINSIDNGIVGDVDYESMIGKASAITPVPGGVGPLTVSMLMDNTITSAERFSLDQKHSSIQK